MLKVANSVINASQIATPITFSGDVTLSTGNLVIGTSGKGVDFSATPSIGTMTSELLSDYEEGTWTPVLGGNGGATGQVYSTQSGSYTKVGRMMTCTMSCTLSTLGTITGGHRITGLPVAASATLPLGSVTITYSANLGVPVVSIGGRVEGSDTTCLIVYRIVAAATTSFDSTSMWTATTSVNATIVYFV